MIVRAFMLALVIMMVQVYSVQAHPNDSWKELLSEIEVSAQRLISDSSYQMRRSAFDALSQQIPRFLEKHFNHIDKLKEVEGILTLSEKPIVICTFQLAIDMDSYTYAGFVLLVDRHQVYTLHDKSEFLISCQYDRLAPVEWYGALYYGMKKLDENTFLLFGYDAYSFFNKKKLIEVLCIEGSELMFGKPIIENPSDLGGNPLARFFIEYSVQAPPILRFDDELKLIIFDHLQPVKGHYKGQEVMFVPDGTYSGFKLKEGRLEYVNHVLDGRRAEPYVDQKGKN